MKVLLLSTFDSDGGAARASYRIYKEIQKQGIEANMLVGTKRSDDFTILPSTSQLTSNLSFIRPILDNLPLKLYKNRSNYLWNVGWLPKPGLYKKIMLYKPDILQLHWVGGGYMPIKLLKKIEVPIVWRLSDSWAFTGGCHIPFECLNYISGCGKCPQLGSGSKHDLSERTLRKKEKYWEMSKLTVVAPSVWMADCARNSKLFKNRPIKVIPPGINISVFKPMNRKYLRTILNLPSDSKLILFGAINSVNDINKGFRLLQNALELLKKECTGDIEVIILGASSPREPFNNGFKTTYVGKINDEITLSLYYAAVDLFVLPSLMENSPNTVIESMACGTPVVAFAVGGVLEMITHLKNGYLARPYDVKDLADGIKWILNLISSDYNSLSENSRWVVVNRFDIQKIGLMYKKLYSNILSK